MQIDIDQNALKGFNEQATDELAKVAKLFIDDLIRESNRIESTMNPNASVPQITSGMVADAAVHVRKGLLQPKKGIWTTILRVVAAVLSLIVGFLYDATKLQDKTYMMGFVVLVAVAILAVTISTMKE